MKKIFGILVLLIVLNGCDDGNLKIETIDFAEVTANSCGETIYKLNGNEAIYIKIPSSLNAFSNEITLTNIPRSIPIGGNVSVTYRAYDGAVTSANICTTPGPISPIATEEWIATSGNIEISTIALYSTTATTGATKITKFVHNIVFKNIVFAKPSGNQIYETFTFGEYTTTPTTLPFSFIPDDIKLCPTNQLLYNARTNGLEGLYIQNFDTSLLSTANLSVPKTGLISSTTNKLVYRLFISAISTSNQDYFCGSTLPTSPAINEEWIAKPGVTDVSGIIEVTTTTNGPNLYQHTILLKAVTFQKGNNSFYYGDSILLGTLLTTN
jgi:hypothetical protein